MISSFIELETVATATTGRATASSAATAGVTAATTATPGIFDMTALFEFGLGLGKDTDANG